MGAYTAGGSGSGETHIDKSISGKSAKAAKVVPAKVVKKAVPAKVAKATKKKG